MTFVRTPFGPAVAAGTVTDANAALCGPPLPWLSTSHSRTEYSPGPGAVTCAAPLAPTATAAGQTAPQSCTIAPVTGAGAFSGLRHASPITFEPPPTAVAVRALGGGGPLLSTTTVGDVTT